VGDCQQGFTTVELPPSAVFHFTYSWTLSGVEPATTIEEMRCAPATE
jgi:hypothetical protein